MVLSYGHGGQPCQFYGHDGQPCQYFVFQLSKTNSKKSNEIWSSGWNELADPNFID